MLIKEAAKDCIDRPIKVVPKRPSGPRMMPSDWYEIDRQSAVAPQCTLCHERALPGMPPLLRGLCGVCRARLSDEPPAAA